MADPLNPYSFCDVRIRTCYNEALKVPTAEKLHINGFGAKMSILSTDVRLLNQR